MPRKKRPPQEGRPDLTPLELRIMHIVWDRGNATAQEVRDALARDRPLADTTIHTVLANLRQKGYLEPVPTIERALRFAPCVPREEVAGFTVRQILSDFFQGSPKRLLAHLLAEETVDEAELEEIRRLLKRGKKT